MERRSLILGVQLPASYWREQLESLRDAAMDPQDTLDVNAALGRGLGMLEGLVAELERAEERIEQQAAEEARAAGPLTAPDDAFFVPAPEQRVEG